MKRIIALIIALTVIISILNISAFADGEAPAMTSQEYRSAQSNLIDKYCNGEITFLEWQERQTAVNTEYLEYNQSLGDTAYAFAITTSNQFAGISEKFANAVQKWGDGSRERVAEWWNSVCNSNNVPTESTQTSIIDMHGYGALVYHDNPNPNKPYTLYIYFKDYVVLNPDTMEYLGYGGGKDVHETSWGSVSEYPFNSTKNNPYYSYTKFYGDIRYADGTPAPTDDEWEYGSIKKFDEMPDKDLEDLLEDFAEEMERQNPDLSTIEGLLKAIYARMGTLDSDNDNDLLNAINANILALVNADKDKDEAEDKTNEELVNTLLEIRDSLKNGTLGTAPASHGHEISGTVYNVIPLDKNFLNKLFHDTENLKVEYEGKVYYLEDCGCLKIGDKYYTPNMNYDSYAFADYDLGNDNIDLDDSNYLGFKSGSPLDIYNNLSPNQKKKVNHIIDGVYEMFTYAVPYTAVTSAFLPFETIIFNTVVPEDIVLNFNGSDGMGDFTVTILSVAFFQNEYVSKAMGIIKPFLMVVIGYCWLKVMRRKIV